jgi:hypothetical protein
LLEQSPHRFPVGVPGRINQRQFAAGRDTGAKGDEYGQQWE